jgi:hypothetical protein
MEDRLSQAPKYFSKIDRIPRVFIDTRGYELHIFSAMFRGFIKKQGARPKTKPIINIGAPMIALNTLTKKRGCSIKGKTRIIRPREIIETIIHPMAGWLPIFLLPTTEQAPTNVNMLINAQNKELLRY